MTSSITLPTAPRAHAQGTYSLEAATELLIDQRTWQRRNDFTTAFISRGRRWRTDVELAPMDWEAAITVLNNGYRPCSGGEGRMLRLAASLTGGIPVDLPDAVTGIDTNNVTLVTKAIPHASDHRQPPRAW